MTVATTFTTRTAAQRLGAIVRLHFANPHNILITPLLVLAIIFGISWALWAIVGLQVAGDPQAMADASQGFSYSGASTWIFVYMLVIGVLAMNNTFPLALGFGATRRDFYAGSLIAFVLLALIYTTVYTVLAAIESATGGWGVGGVLFTSPFFGGAGTPLLLRAFHVLCAFLFFFAVGTGFAATFVRWGQRGLLLLFAALAVVLLGSAALITAAASWGRVGDFFSTAGFTGSYSLALLLAALVALGGWGLMRRARPRS